MSPADLCTYLPWDSDFFGLHIARANTNRLDDASAAAILTWCAEQGIDCLYFLAAADDACTVTLAERHDFHLVDMRVSLDRALNGDLRPPNGSVIRPCASGDLPTLRSIARRLHCDSRFYFDTHFTRAQCDALYETWIANSCAGYADAVLVADVDGEAVGYCTCHKRPGTGQIGLFGVSEHFQGRGLGSDLIRAALAWFAAQGYERASVVTQGRNSGAQRVYQKHGFMTRSVQLWYHRWFGDGGSR